MPDNEPFPDLRDATPVEWEGNEPLRGRNGEIIRLWRLPDEAVYVDIVHSDSVQERYKFFPECVSVLGGGNFTTAILNLARAFGGEDLSGLGAYELATRLQSTE